MEIDRPTATSSEAPEVVAFGRAFDAWAETGGSAPFPFDATLSAFHALGKHFAPPAVTDRLAAARGMPEPPFGPGLLAAFLETALDKHEGRYDYSSYCALELLALPEAGVDGLGLSEIAAGRDAALLGLLGDLLGFEFAAFEGRATVLPGMRPNPELAGKRLSLILAALRPTLRRLGWSETGAALDPTVRACLDWRETRLSDEVRARLDLSLLPVHVVHDEYLFLRTLQSFEATFAWISVLLRTTIVSLRSDTADAIARMRLANGFLRETARLFPLISSMQVAAFHDFRRFTEGASAIQSVGYKTVEALCRRPDPERLESVAYQAVPEVRASAAAGQETIEEAFAAACNRGPDVNGDCAAFAEEMQVFSTQMLRWRQAHYQIARRFLGERGGTGYTEGVPYLERIRQVPVFDGVTQDL